MLFKTMLGTFLQYLWHIFPEIPTSYVEKCRNLFYNNCFLGRRRCFEKKNRYVNFSMPMYSCLNLVCSEIELPAREYPFRRLGLVNVILLHFLAMWIENLEEENPTQDSCYPRRRLGTNSIPGRFFFKASGYTMRILLKNSIDKQEYITVSSRV